MTRREAQAVFDRMSARDLQRLAATLQEQATRLQTEASQAQRHAQWARNELRKRRREGGISFQEKALNDRRRLRNG